jgi:hypothetical protein
MEDGWIMHIHTKSHHTWQPCQRRKGKERKGKGKGRGTGGIDPSTTANKFR